MSCKELQYEKGTERLCSGDMRNQEASDEMGICRRQSRHIL